MLAAPSQHAATAVGALNRGETLSPNFETTTVSFGSNGLTAWLSALKACLPMLPLGRAKGPKRVVGLLLVLVDIVIVAIVVVLWLLVANC